EQKQRVAVGGIAGVKGVFRKFGGAGAVVVARARGGRTRSSSPAVTRIDQTNSGILCMVMPRARMLKIVVMKLMAPRTEEAPARWIDKITKSTAGPGCPVVDSGA